MANKIKILLVEDEAITAKGLKMDLEELGYEVLKPVAKGEEAISVAVQEDPALILMDIRLAGRLNGIEAAERIHSKKMIPIAYMTGYATEEIKAQALKTNPLGLLEKPVDINNIKQILDHFTISSQK